MQMINCADSNFLVSEHIVSKDCLYILYFSTNPVSQLNPQKGILHKCCFSFISAAYIKEEPEDAACCVKIKPEMKPVAVTENGFNGTNFSISEIDIKEEPLQDDFVSILLN